jgi:hypothetical protein
MSTVDHLTFFTATDIINRRIMPSRIAINRAMNRQVDPFPRPIILREGKRQKNQGDTSNRYSGRRVVWRVLDIELWLEGRAKSSTGSAAQ